MNKTHLPLIALLLLAGCDYAPNWLGGEAPEKNVLPGERITVLPATGIASDTALQAVPFALPGVMQNAEWPQHTGIFTAANSNLALSGTLESKQNAKVGDGDEFEHPLIPRPVVADGVVYAMDATGHISAHDAGNVSNVRWVSRGVAEKDEPDIIGGGLAFADGKLYVTSGRGVIIALDAASGTELWRQSLRTPFRSAPHVSEGRVLAITIDSQLFAFNAASGAFLWSHRGITETAGLMNTVSPVIAGGDVIVPYPSGEIYALVATDGRPLWSESLVSGARTLASSVFTGIGGDPVVDGEVVIAVSGGGRLAVFVRATGQRLWEQPVASLNTPWVSGNYLFVLGADNTLTCFLKYDGRVRWSVRLPAFKDDDELEPIVWRGPVLVNDKLALIGSHEEMLLISAADGTVTATIEIPEGRITPPVVAGGVLYFVDQSARLHALK